jgi:hypothetical protein
MKTSAATPMIASLENAISIMSLAIEAEHYAPGGTHPAGTGAKQSAFRFFLHFDVDSPFVRDLRCCAVLRCGLVFLAFYAVLETLDSLADVGTHIAEFFGTEYQHHNDQHN